MPHPTWADRVSSSATLKDLNADGKPEILISSSSIGTSQHTLYAYTIPETPEEM